MPRKKAAKKRKKTGARLPTGAAIYAKLTATMIHGAPSILVHGPGGPYTGFVARKGGAEVALPGATIVNVPPGTNYVAWDGVTFLIRSSIESILEREDLSLVGQVEVPAPVINERPFSDELTCEQIDQLLHQVDERHWPTITAMRVKKFYPPDKPVPPQSPKQLLNWIELYARMIFGTEANQYDQFRKDGRYPAWLLRLAERTIKRVVSAVEKLDDGDPQALLLNFHGLAMKEIEKSLRDLLLELRNQYEQGMAPSQRSQRNAAATPARPSAQPVPAKVSVPQESVAEQLKRLKVECRLTAQEMADALEVNLRSIFRNLNGAMPRATQIAAYEKLFSERLGRAITLKNVTKTPS